MVEKRECGGESDDDDDRDGCMAAIVVECKLGPVRHIRIKAPPSTHPILQTLLPEASYVLQRLNHLPVLNPLKELTRVSAHSHIHTR